MPRVWLTLSHARYCVRELLICSDNEYYLPLMGNIASRSCSDLSRNWKGKFVRCVPRMASAGGKTSKGMAIARSRETLADCPWTLDDGNARSVMKVLRWCNCTLLDASCAPTTGRSRPETPRLLGRMRLVDGFHVQSRKVVC